MILKSNTNKNSNWWETEVGKKIITDKYLHENETTFDQFIGRVAGIFEDVDMQADIIKALRNADFFPAGRSLYGAGSKGKFKASMSNCYILPMPDDNIESIYDVAAKQARIYSYGGGTGLNLSSLRPNYAAVNNSALTSSGAVSFANVYDNVGKVIGASNKKKGNTSARRAALMLGLNCEHPDLEEFLALKKNNTEIQSANTSILFTDEFMKAVLDGGYFWQKFTTPHETIKKEIDAVDFFERFAENNWDFAEPGAIFIDTVRKNHILSGYPEDIYKIDISNPCSEYFGNAYNACNLGSINLYNCVDYPFTNKATLNYAKLDYLVDLGIRALDEILDYGYSMQPLDENRKCIDDWRAIGLGLFGLADAFVAMGIEYGSAKSVQLAEDIAKTMFYRALNTSCSLAVQKGTFGKYDWNYIKESPLIKKLKNDNYELYEAISEHGLRNGSLLSIAPTGSIATMCNCSGGVEPLFAISYKRTTHALQKEGKFFKVLPKSIEDLLIHHGINAQTISDEEIVKKFPFIKVSHEINPMDRIDLQSALQGFVDNAISSTVNLKNEATKEEVYELYIKAWQYNCKGITVFRNGCSRSPILVTNDEEHTSQPVQIQQPAFDSITPTKIGDVDCRKIVKHTACVDKLYVFVCNDGGNIVEVFTNIVQGCTSNIASLTRLTSASLRAGVTVEYVIKALRKTKCQGCLKAKEKDATISLSCGSAIADAIEQEYIRLKGEKKAEDNGLMKCPECGEKTLRPEGKCFNCHNCGYSKCE